MKRTLAPAVALLLALISPVARPDPQALSPEDRLRAAFVLRLSQYTQWPPPPPGDGVRWLCVAGMERGMEALRALDNRLVGDQQLRVRELAQPSDATSGCHVLLLGHADANSLRRWLRAAGELPVLTMGTSAEAWRAGVAVALISEPQGLTFAVDQGDAKRRQLVLAAPVLKLAREVR